MTVEYTICDRCAASVPDATGAIVLPFNGLPRMHLCEKCVEELLAKPESTMMKLKGDFVQQKQEVNKNDDANNQNILPLGTGR